MLLSKDYGAQEQTDDMGEACMEQARDFMYVYIYIHIYLFIYYRTYMYNI